MIFKSRQVNLDPEPWRVRSTGARLARSVPQEQERIKIWDPRPEFEPTRDPYPWVYFDHRNTSLGRFATLIEAERHGDRTEFAPRRDQFDTPVNPILVEFRKLWKGQPDILEMADQWARFELDGDWESPMTGEYSTDHIEHAHRVLTRLAALL